MRRPVTAVLALLATGSLVLAGCTNTGSQTPGKSRDSVQSSGSSAPSETTTTTPAVPPVAMTASVANSATKVPVDTTVTVTASGGTLDTVAMSYIDRKTAKAVTVAGTLSDDKATWTAGDLLEPGVTYTVAMTGANTDGAPSSTKSTFSTQPLTNAEQIYPTLLPEDGATVGVGMPIVALFDLPVPDRAAFEKKMTVTTTPAVPGSWYWISSQEAHWRPQKYWTPGTKVSVDLALNGVRTGKAMFGELSRKASFTIGSATTAKINLKTHQLTLFRGGAAVRTFPITGGKPASPTRSGIKVVMLKRSNFEMRAESLGLKKGDAEYYQPVHVAYALQVTASGEYLHSAPWSVGSQGYANVSHGCVGMSVSNSLWLYNNMKVGDVVEVTGSSRYMTMGNGYADWNMPWAQWQKGSALS